MNGRATQDREEKSEVKAKQLQAKADAEGEREDTTTTRDADIKFLNDVTATCEQKGTDYVSHAEEMEALSGSPLSRSPSGSPRAKS